MHLLNGIMIKTTSYNGKTVIAYLNDRAYAFAGTINGERTNDFMYFKN